MIGDDPHAQAAAGLLIACTSILLGLLGLWIASSPRHWLLRFGAGAAVLCLGLPIKAYDLTAAVFIGWLLIVAIVQFRRYWLQRRTAIEGDVARWRFSLADLLLLTVAFAATMAVASQVPRMEWGVWRVVLIAAAIFAMAVLSSAWMVFSRARRFLRAIAVIGVCLVSAFAMAGSAFLHGEAEITDPEEYHKFVEFYGACVFAAAVGTALMVAGVLVLACARGPLLRALLVMSLLALFTPVGLVYYRLLRPTPAPVAKLPIPNGFDQLRLLGQKLKPPAGVPGFDPATATQSQLATFVADNAEVLQEIRAAIELPFARPLEYTLEDITANEYLSELREAARALYAAGRLAEIEGRMDDAVSEYMAAARLGRVVLNDGLLIDYLVGIAFESIGSRPLQSVRSNLDGDQARRLLASIQSQLQPHTSPDAHVKRDVIWEEHVGDWQSRVGVILGEFVGAEGPITKSIRDLHTREQTLLNLLCTDLALRCYLSDHGQLPMQLSELSPDYFSTPLADPCSGEPLIYKAEGGSFTLYSVGADMQDDGGTPSQFFGTAGDLLLEPATMVIAAPTDK